MCHWRHQVSSFVCSDKLISSKFSATTFPGGSMIGHCEVWTVWWNEAHEVHVPLREWGLS